MSPEAIYLLAEPIDEAQAREVHRATDRKPPHPGCIGDRFCFPPSCLERVS
jgi:hypothetical protein